MQRDQRTSGALEHPKKTKDRHSKHNNNRKNTQHPPHHKNQEKETNSI